MKGNVLTGSLFDKKTIITELTERKLEYINMSESEGEKVYIKMIYGIDPYFFAEKNKTDKNHLPVTNDERK